MRIKKILDTVGLVGNVLNQKSSSKKDAYSCDYVNKLNTYSEEEQIVGIWIDGKPLYRQLVHCGFLISGDQTVSHNIQNIDTIIHVRAWFKNVGNNTWFPIPRVYPTDLEKYAVALDVDKTSMYFTNGTNFNGKTFFAYAIIEYTKTTDEGAL